MRFSYVIIAFTLLGITSAQLAAIAGAVKGVAALGSGIAKLASAVVPTGLLLPLGMVGPLKSTIPAILGVKGLALLKLKLLMKVPFLVPLGIGTGKVALVGAKAKLAKSAVGAAMLAPVGLPLGVAAMKTSAIAGATAVAIAGPEPAPRKRPLIISAAAVLEAHKMAFEKEKADESSSHTMPNAEPEEPAYGTKRTSTTTTTTTTTTKRPALAYTPAPPAYTPAPGPGYRKRREVKRDETSKEEQVDVQKEDLKEQEAELEESMIRQTFTLIHTLDREQCVTRAICEIAVDPKLAQGYASDILGLLSKLNDEEASPWSLYKKAMENGLQSGSRKICYRKYRECARTVEELVKQAIAQTAYEN